MEFRILGHLEAVDEGRVVTPRGAKQRSLLALLVLHANETLSTDRLIDELWGEHPPTTAAKTLQVHISHLRKTLAGGTNNDSGDIIVTRDRGYELRLDPERLDSHQFELLVAEREASWPRAAPSAPFGRSSGRSRCGAGRPSRTSRTSVSPSARSLGWQTCGPPRSSSSWRRSWSWGAMTRWCHSSRR